MTPKDNLQQVCWLHKRLKQAYSTENSHVYGAYIMGREWIFAKLQGRHFIQSLPFLLTDEAMLMKMFSCLKALKEIILAQKQKSLTNRRGFFTK